MDAWIKNLWLLLTLAIPGAATYGTWRLVLILNGSTYIDKGTFEKMDASALVTTCVIIAVAVLQQAIAIPIEPVLSAIFRRTMGKQSVYHKLFYERFKLAAGGQLNEEATRILGNFFVSVNVVIGQCMILVYLLVCERPPRQLAVMVVAVFITMGVASAVYRLRNAASILEAGQAGPIPKKMQRPA